MKESIATVVIESAPEANALAKHIRSGIPNYRKDALKAYPPYCVHCGFGIPEVLEVAHLDCNPQNCDVTNLAILCPTCHRMHDINLIPTAMIRSLRDERPKADWSKLYKDAVEKANDTKRKKKESAKRSATGKKAAATRAARKLTQPA